MINVNISSADYTFWIFKSKLKRGNAISRRNNSVRYFFGLSNINLWRFIYNLATCKNNYR